MRKFTIALVLASAFIAIVTAGPALYANEGQMRSGSMMHRGMMGMMNMKGQGMMDHCMSMMGGGKRPNDQWRRQTPAVPGKGD
jgi:hypothetical protein